jgi:Domain of unknown function (DUF4981)/Beta galactosidase small chain
MFSPDRSPHPSVHEIRFLQQPALIKPEELDDSGTICLNVATNRSVSFVLSIENRYSFRQLDHIDFSWVLTTSRSADMVRSERFKVERSDGVHFEASIQFDGGVISRILSIVRSSPTLQNDKFWITFKGVLHDNCDWAPAGHELISIQYPVKFTLPDVVAKFCKERPIPKKPTIVVVGDLFYINREDHCTGKTVPLAALDKTTGVLRSYVPLGGQDVFAGPMLPSFCRAFTDNDRGGMDLVFPDWFYPAYMLVRGSADFSYASHWKLHGLDPDRPPNVCCSRCQIIEGTSPNSISVEVLCNVVASNNNTHLFAVATQYDFFHDGRVCVSQR